MKLKYFLIVSALFLSGLFCRAQEPILFHITYEFTHVRDLSDKEKLFTDNMILSVGKNSSRYISEKMYDQLQSRTDSKIPDNILITEKESGQRTVVSGSPLLIVDNDNVVVDEQILKDFTTKKLSVWGAMGPKDYKTETNLQGIDWQIMNEQKTIGDYNCQKASGRYGGRTYEVWFTQDLPLQDGPWKLSGLPGLILEARDSRNEVAFIFKKIQKPYDENETTASFFKNEDQTFIDTKPKNYNQNKKAFITDPESVWSAAFPDAKLGIINQDHKRATQSTRIKKYNPLEIK